MYIIGTNHHLLKDRRQALRRDSTNVERILWQELRGRKMFGLHIFRQYSHGPYILDFYCPAIRLSIELDGAQHAEDAQVGYDEERTGYLRGQDIHELRFWNQEVDNELEKVLSKIKDEIGAKIQ